MPEVARQPLTKEQFYEWVVGRDTRHELVDGEPVLPASTNRRHDTIAINTILAIGNHLRGHLCRPFTSDTYVSIPAGNARLPDLGIDCGPFNDTSLEAAEPALLVEILSPTTRAFDRNEKLEEYKTLPSLEYILLIDPDDPQVRLYQRAPDRSWTSARLTGLDAVEDIPIFNLSLKLSDLYANLEFRPRPILVDPENPAAAFSI
jgi:Uma2 family endonuclease